MIKSTLWRWAVPGALLLTGCAVAYSWLAPRPKPRTVIRAERTEKTQTHVDEAAQRKLDERQRIIDELTVKLQQRSSHQANVRTRTVERIERYAPPSGSAIPVRVAASGAPEPIPGAQPAPYEVVTRETTTEDTSRAERSTDADMTRKTDVDTTRAEATESRRIVDSKTERTEKTETKTGGSGGSKQPRLGFGFQAGADGGPGITAKYDLIRLNGPKFLGLKKYFVAAGVGLEKKGLDTDFTLKSIDGGPYGSIGKGRLSIDLGYRVREREPVLGLTYRTTFK